MHFFYQFTKQNTILASIRHLQDATIQLKTIPIGRLSELFQNMETVKQMSSTVKALGWQFLYGVVQRFLLISDESSGTLPHNGEELTADVLIGLNWLVVSNDDTIDNHSFTLVGSSKHPN